MKKNVYFLCYSRYVIFVAYILKEMLFKDDKVHLIIPDSTHNYDGLVEQMERSKCWDEVLPFQEIDDIGIVKQRVKDFVQHNKIDIFFVAHIMRSASHFFTKYLPDTTEINMFDEGCITLDFLGIYKNYCRHGLADGWTNFHFKRIRNIYSFFPDITKAFFQAKVKGIEFSYIINKEFVEKINRMYEYEYIRQDIEILYIDSNLATAGLYSHSYDQFCIDNILENIDCSKCYVKRKPAVKEYELYKKYEKYNIRYIEGGMVPFEIIYLNMIINDNLPQLIICTNSAAIWNINYLNVIFKRKLDIVVLIDIVKTYYWDVNFREDVQRRLQLYNTYFPENYKVISPKTWDELYDFMERYHFFIKPDINIIKERELECIKKEYLEICHRELHFYRPRFKEAYNWIKQLAQGKSVDEKLLNSNEKKIVVYGVGDFAKLFLESIDKKQIHIECFIVTKASEEKKYKGIKILSVNEFIIDENINKLPILISAVGSEEEIKYILREKEFLGKIYTFSDLF